MSSWTLLAIGYIFCMATLITFMRGAGGRLS
jgi:hypothetical protein